jgi:hypothetical protein
VVNRPIATLAVALGLLAACGGSGGTGDEATVDVAAPATATTAHIPATDSVASPELEPPPEPATTEEGQTQLRMQEAAEAVVLKLATSSPGGELILPTRKRRA